MQNKNNFGVVSVNDKDILFYTVGGTFASSAWIKGDKEYNQVLGSKFSAYTADDGLEYNLDRKNIRRVKDDKEFNDLLAQASSDFQFVLKVLEIQTIKLSQQFAKCNVLDLGYTKVAQILETDNLENTIKEVINYIKSK